MAKKEDRSPEEVVTDFLTCAHSNKNPQIICGIDPGGDGAIGFLCARHYAVVDIPVQKTSIKRTRRLSVQDAKLTGHKTKTIDGKTTIFDLHGIIALFKLLYPHRDFITIGLEQAKVKVAGKVKPFGKNAMTGGTALTGYKVGLGFGMWPLFLASKRFAVDIIEPSVWKQAMGLAGKDKNASRSKALSLFPDADIKLVKYHNRAEALLLCEYLRRTHGRGPS